MTPENMENTQSNMQQFTGAVDNSVTVECMRCGARFTISADERKWYEERGMVLPKRCKMCRSVLKEIRRAFEMGRQSVHPNKDGDGE